jgi:hypothetical protein
MATGQLSLVDSFNRWAGAKEGNCRLHPLIYTFPPADLTQDIVAVSKWQKCGLKYVIHTPIF